MQTLMNAAGNRQCGAGPHRAALLAGSTADGSVPDAGRCPAPSHKRSCTVEAGWGVPCTRAGSGDADAHGSGHGPAAIRRARGLAMPHRPCPTAASGPDRRRVPTGVPGPEPPPWPAPRPVIRSCRTGDGSSGPRFLELPRGTTRSPVARHPSHDGACRCAVWIPPSLAGYGAAGGPYASGLTDAPVREGKAGWHVFDDGAHVSLGRLKGDKGSQNHLHPQGIDPSSCNSVSIWCARFGVSLGAAELARVRQRCSQVPPLAVTHPARLPGSAARCARCRSAAAGEFTAEPALRAAFASAPRRMSAASWSSPA